MPTRIASPSTEHVLEKRLTKVLKHLGYRSIHNDPSVMKGIPDRYVIGAGGLWIEVKLEDSWYKLVRGFDRQKAFMDMAIADDPYVFAFLETKENWNSNKLYFEPWSIFKARDYSHHFNERDQSPFKIVTYDDIDRAIETVMKVIHP